MGQANRKPVAPNNVSTITMHRLLVIEWLGDNDVKIGQELVRQLLLKAPNLPIELVICNSKHDVLAAIAKATGDVPRLGVPILHIEAHGYVLGDEAQGFCGPGAGRDEVLLWPDLREPLRTLNFATQFNLVVVAAACLSESVLFTTQSDRPIPFMVAISLRTQLSWSELERAMVAFYDTFLAQNLSFGEAFESAVEQLNSSQKLGCTFMLRLVRDILQDVIDEHGDKAHFDDIYRQGSVARRLNGWGIQTRLEALKDWDASIAPVIDRAVASLLAYDRIPENRARFGIDANHYARQAVRNRRWSV